MEPIASTEHLKAPRTAAIAGIAFSVLLISGFLLLRNAIPADPLEAGAWLRARTGVVGLGLNAVPFAGIAFLWFMGVLRDRLGAKEDRFLATVFLGSGLLFLAMLFVAAAFLGGIVIAHTARYDQLVDSVAFSVARAVAYEAMNVYAIKMAAVFTLVTCTLALRTHFVPRWIAFAGYAAALVLLFANRYVEYSVLVFPLWVLLISLYILFDSMRGSGGAAKSPSGTSGE
jgi:hypothetical protein